jgi:hypothetical protein
MSYDLPMQRLVKEIASRGFSAGADLSKVAR